MLDLRELVELCRDLVGELSSSEAGFVQALLDADGNGRISMQEFVSGARDASACVGLAQRSASSSELLQLLNAVCGAVSKTLPQFWGNYLRTIKTSKSQ